MDEVLEVEQGLVMSADSSRAQFASVKDDLKKLKEQMHVIHREARTALLLQNACFP